MKTFVGVATIAVALVAVATLSVVAAPIDKSHLPVTKDTPLKAPPAVIEPMTFELIEPSMATWGCWHPCMCPVHLIGDMQGEFTLVEIEATEHTVVYAIENLAWDVYDFHWGEGYLYTVTGSGTLVVSSPERGVVTQQVLLDLEYDGQSDGFDSGEVPFTGFESLAFTVANNGFVCLNDAFMVQAELVQSPETMSQVGAESQMHATLTEDVGLRAAKGD